MQPLCALNIPFNGHSLCQGQTRFVKSFKAQHEYTADNVKNLICVYDVVQDYQMLEI